MKPPRSYHDLGGRRAGKVKPALHDYADWERRIDAMAVLLWGQKGGKQYLTVDEHRKNIEALPPAAYDSMTYYEKWILSLAQCLIQRGVVTSDELARRMREAAGPRSHHDMGGLPGRKVKRAEHAHADWEHRIDAMAMLLQGLSGAKKRATVDERRRAIEALPPDAYDRMGYYERWVMSLATVAVQRGLLTTGELARKMEEVESRD